MSGRYVTRPMAEVVSAQKGGPLQVYKDRWWAVDEHGDPIFYESGHGLHPQCNPDKAIVQLLMVESSKSGAVEAVFLPWAYQQFNLSDYL